MSKFKQKSGIIVIIVPVCVQFNDVLLLCKSLPLNIGQRQQYRVKTVIDIDGIEVNGQPAVAQLADMTSIVFFSFFCFLTFFLLFLFLLPFCFSFLSFFLKSSQDSEGVM